MRNRALVAAAVCLLLAASFASISYTAILRKSATLDEPLHVAGAFADAKLGDHRIDLENPPLWKYWMMLPISSSALRWDQSSADWHASTNSGEAQVWATRTLYQTSGNDGIALINNARAMMLLLAVATMLVTSVWAYRLAGNVSAIAATVLFAFDPTLLAQGPIVKNDIALAACMLVLVASLTSAMRRITAASAIGIALSCAAAMNIKLSGLLLPVIAAVLLLGRVIMHSEGEAPAEPVSHQPKKRLGRSLALPGRVFAVLIASALTCYIVTWAAYGFRIRATANPADSIDLQPTLARIAENNHARGRDDGPGWQVRTALAIHRHHLLPEAWIVGFIRFKSVSDIHQNYLLGEVRDSGFWSYFPLALTVKLPLATLAAGTIAGLFLVIPSWRRRLALDDRQRNAILCCAVASVIYLAAAMDQNINHGIRHLLPLFPLAFIVIAIVFARFAALRPKPAIATAVGLALLLLVEVLPAWPNYLPFFNLAAGGSTGGLRILGDSNLDWGQDLPLLAQWQREHPSEKLYLCYYGAADPAAYGIVYTNLASGFFLGPPPEPITTPGVIAISATRLQGLYMSEGLRGSYARLRTQTPRQILGGSIYLFDYPAK